MSNQRVPVTAYAAQWNPNTKVGNIVVTVGGRQVPLPPLSAPEFNATLLMLSKKDVMLDTRQWDFELNTRPTGT